MIDANAMLDTTPYTVQYERLRSQVIGTGGQARGIGLALLLSEGLPGWLQAVASVLRASLAAPGLGSPDPAPHQGSTGCSAAPLWLSNVPRHEVTALLASLVLSTRPLTHSSSTEAY